MWYVYAYLRKNKTPYYIGKGSGKRCYVKHRRGNGGFSAPEKERILILKEFNNEDECFQFEKYMIFLYGRKIDGGILINECLGGLGKKTIFTEDERIQKRKQSRQKWLEKNKEYHKNYWEKNKEKLNNKQNERYYGNLESRKQYWQDNKEQLNKKQREKYNEGESEKRKEYKKNYGEEYRKKNREKHRQYMKQYYNKKKLENSNEDE
jgi:hypothetical protein